MIEPKIGKIYKTIHPVLAISVDGSSAEYNFIPKGKDVLLLDTEMSGLGFMGVFEYEGRKWRFSMTEVVLNSSI